MTVSIDEAGGKQQESDSFDAGDMFSEDDQAASRHRTGWGRLELPHCYEVLVIATFFLSTRLGS